MGTVKTWLFDLDNTLHDASKGIFQAIDHGMLKAVQSATGLCEQRADKLRIEYWRKYGATVIVMEKHHNTNAKEFLRSSHDFNIASMVHAEPQVAHKISRLPGRKIVLTNAPEDYARQVLDHLKLLPHFDGIWAIEHMRLQGRLRPKPSIGLMRQIIARLKTPPSNIALVEDTLKNLKSAHKIGMKTVHIAHPMTPFAISDKVRPSYVDVRVKRLGDLINVPMLWRTQHIQDHA